MITDSLMLRIEYEVTRMGRYQGFRQCGHTQEQFDETYYAWANATMGREREWDRYCDVRDGYPMGTNQKIRKRRAENQRIVFVQ